MKRVLIALIRFYRKHISSKTAPCCRFTPTCSQYAITAIERFGAIRGTFMAIWRILRCGPWTAGGYDPVPEKKKRNKCCGKKHKDEKDDNEFETGASVTSIPDDDEMTDDSSVISE